MWLKSVELTNIKSFANSGMIGFSPGINLLVGPNNAGKSTIIRAISILQPLPNHPDVAAFLQINVRHNADNCQVVLELESPIREQLRFISNWDLKGWHPTIRFIKNPPRLSPPIYIVVRAPTGQDAGITPPLCNSLQPHNFIYAYFSRRKPATLHEAINLTNAQSIEEALQHLPSKVDQLSNSKYSATFNEVCQNTLGFSVGCIHSPGGKQLGLVLENDTIIPVTTMGEGTMNILVFLVHLASASGKLFLIEEIENDLHPTALKHLLDYIIAKSESNQFIISTHSNIVVRYLGTAPKSKLFSIQMKLEDASRIPTSVCQPVGEEAEDRIQLLESLGYEPFDFYLWKGYLILEESTAERLIRDFFIPFLVPNLQGKLKTIAAQGVSDVPARFSDLLRLFVFIHTAPQYKERAWVAVDGGVEGKKVVSDLKARFKSWPEQHFRCFTADDFERYYPSEFMPKVTEVLSMPNGKPRQEAKGKLAEEVLEWALADLVRAHKEFNMCAKEVLDFLKEIAGKLA